MRWLSLLVVFVGCASTGQSRAQETEHQEHAEHHDHAPASQEPASEDLPAIPEGHIRVSLAWQNHGLEAQMASHLLPGGVRAKLWDMGTGENAAELPIGEVIDGGHLVVTPGSVSRFVLVMKNPTDAPLYFFAAPHHVNPVQLSLGFKFKCLCINHAFEIPPGHTWYRVVELRMDEGFVGDAITIEHALIGLDEARKREFEMPQ